MTTLEQFFTKVATDGGITAILDDAVKRAIEKHAPDLTDAQRAVLLSRDPKKIVDYMIANEGQSSVLGALDCIHGHKAAPPALAVVAMSPTSTTSTTTLAAGATPSTPSPVPYVGWAFSAAE